MLIGEWGLRERGEEKARIGRGRGVFTCIGLGPESELDVDITEAFLLRAAKLEDKVISRAVLEGPASIKSRQASRLQVSLYRVLFSHRLFPF